jgi:hypothetical protein
MVFSLVNKLTITVGTRAAGTAIQAISNRTKRAVKLIKEYNKKVDRLPPGEHNPAHLPDDIKKYLDNESALFDLERFGSNERWAKEPGLRRAITKLKEWDRVEEEVQILAVEDRRFIHEQWRFLENNSNDAFAA